MIVVNRRRHGIDNTWSSRIAYELRCLSRSDTLAMIACYAITLALGVSALYIAGWLA